MLACRTCRVSLAANSGCAICNPIRKNLTVIGETEEEKPSLANSSNEVVLALRAQLKTIKEAIRAGDDVVKAETRLLALANTMSKVLESARKLQDDGIAAVENMSFAEKAEMFIQWVTSLPPGFRNTLRAKWDEWEQLEAKPQMSLANGN